MSIINQQLINNLGGKRKAFFLFGLLCFAIGFGTVSAYNLFSGINYYFGDEEVVQEYSKYQGYNSQHINENSVLYYKCDSASGRFDEPHGVAFFTINDTLIQEVDYLHGKRDGYTKYFVDGKVTIIRTFKNDVLHDTSFYLLSDGRVDHYEVYQDAKLSSVTYNDEQGGVMIINRFDDDSTITNLVQDYISPNTEGDRVKLSLKSDSTFIFGEETGVYHYNPDNPSKIVLGEQEWIITYLGDKTITISTYLNNADNLTTYTGVSANLYN